MLNRVFTSSNPIRSPSCKAALSGDVLRVVIGGAWTLPYLDEIYAASSAIAKDSRARSVEIDLEDLDLLDTAGAFALVKLRKTLALPSSIVKARPEYNILLDEVSRAANVAADPPPRQSALFLALSRAADATTSIIRDFIRLTMFLGEVAAAIGRILVRPWNFRGTSFIFQIQQTGMNAVPIIVLVCFLLGGVVMQQGAQQLRNFGAETLAVDLLGILTLREVGVLLTAVMVAGRSSSAFTAQIGTMKMREEIDAMRTLGIDPIETLVVPRILALMIVLPLLVFIADMAALAGGAAMAKLYLNLDLPIYLQRLNGAVASRHFFVGLIKAPFAALIIGLVGCIEGLSVTGSAESVGTQVTTAVVKAIFLVLLLDGIFAIFLSASGF